MWSAQDGQHILTRRNAHYPHNFWSSYEYLIHYQSENPRAHKLATTPRPPQIMLTIEPRVIIIFFLARSPM